MKSINKIQFEIIKEKVIKYLITNGIEPTSFTVNSMINDILTRKNLGAPAFKHFNLSDTISNSKEWEESFKNLEEDMNVLYKSNVVNNEEILNKEKEYEKIKNQVYNAITELNYNINSIEYSLNTAKNINKNLFVLKDFRQIELDGIQNRNIPQTTSFIDLLQKNITNDKSDNNFDRIDISKALIQTKMLTHTSYVIDNNIENVVNDFINDRYLLEAGSEIDRDQVLQIDIEFDSKKTFNKIQLDISSSNVVYGKILTSEDNENYETLNESEGTNLMDFSFDVVKTKNIRIVLVKPNADGFINNEYKYYFIINSILCMYEEYKTSSVFVTKPFKFDMPAENMILEADEYVYPNTDISYYIGIDNGNNIINWIPINNRKKVNMQLLKHNRNILNFSENNPNYNTKINNCYKICKISNTVNKNSIVLYPGYQTYKVKVYDLGMKDYNKIDFMDIAEDKLLETCYIDMEEYDIELYDGLTYVFECFVYCDKESYVNNKHIKIVEKENSKNKINYSVFVNNYEISSKNNFKFRKGKNKVNFIVTCNFGTNTDNNSKSKIIHNFNFKENSFISCAAPRAKYINPNVLANIVCENNLKFYSINTNNNILVKTNAISKPKYIGLQYPDYYNINGQSYLSYYIKYKDIRDDKKQFITINNTNVTFNLRLMAILTSNSINISPKVKGFKLISE